MSDHFISPTSVPRPLNIQDYKTLTLSALGGALEFYDFIIFVFFSTVIGQLFFPPDLPDWLRQLQTFGLFAAGYLARPLGGIILAHFGDLLGRKRMFALSIFLMAVPTLAVGFLPTYSVLGMAAPIMLLLLRIMQGAAIGGEVPGAWVFVSEHVPYRHIGYACGTLTCGLTGGILLGSLVATRINASFSPAEIVAYAWRIPFVLGGLFGLLSAYLRRWLKETPIFIEMQNRQQLAAELPLKSVLRHHRRAVILTVLLTWLLSAAVVVVILMTPTLLQKLYGYSAAIALQANSFATLALTIGCMIAGWITDRIGPGRTFIYGNILLAASTWLLYAGLKTHPDMLIPLYSLAGLSVGLIGAIPYVMVMSFPAAVRFTGISFSYNVAYAIFGGLTPMIISLMLLIDPMAPAQYLLILSMVGLMIGVYLRCNEKRGKK
jgi:MFS family permease